MAKKVRRRRRRDKLAATEAAYLGMIKAQFDRQQGERDALDKSMEILSERYKNITGTALLDGTAPLIRRGRPPKGTKAEGKKRGPRGSKKQKNLRVGEQIHSVLAKDKGTKFSTDALRTKLGDNGAPIGPAKNAWNEEHPDQKIEAGGTSGRSMQYWVKG